MNPGVDTYFSGLPGWQGELAKLRAIVLDCGLAEELKWASPCYTFEGKNVVLLGGSKDCCVLGFPKGALLKDTEEILEKPGDNTQAARVVRFGGMEEIVELEDVLKTYVREAVEIENAGLKVDFRDNRDLVWVDELREALDGSPELKAAFEALTPGRRRAYNMHFEAAKQPKTRVARIEKFRPRILDGKGLNDCTCGFSKKMPQCDGSHKFIGCEKKGWTAGEEETARPGSLIAATILATDRPRGTDAGSQRTAYGPGLNPCEPAETISRNQDPPDLRF